MYEVVGIKFKDNGRVYYFSPDGRKIKKGDIVIVETTRGLELGECITDIFDETKKNIILPLKRVVRIATQKDIEKNKRNLQAIPKIKEKFEELADKHKLNIKLTHAEYTFKREQLIFYFISEHRVDFRKLVKDLASEFKTRIELRQIGVRDKAKAVGGIGPCGRELCCTTFLDEFSSVSINMAKNQNLSLTPEKINGVCGRLLCCLRYEDDTYTKMKRELPDVGELVKTEHGEGRVIQIDIVNQKCRVSVPDYGIVTKDLSIKEEK